jgi:hypothetical protein
LIERGRVALRGVPLIALRGVPLIALRGVALIALRGAALIARRERRSDTVPAWPVSR